MLIVAVALAGCSRATYWEWADRDVYPVISVQFRNTYVLSARMGITIDGVDIGRDAIIDGVQPYKLNETYATRGIHSSARNRCNGARASITHAETQTKYTIESLGGIAGRKPLPVGMVIVSQFKKKANWRPQRLSPGQGTLALLANAVAVRLHSACLTGDC